MTTETHRLTERAARMALTCAMDGGDPAVSELVERMGAQDAWNRILEGALGDAAARRARGTQLDLVDRLAVATQTRFVVPGDQEWPDSLDDLAETEAIQRRGGRPVGLWLRGPGHLAELVARSVAIVGSRAATNYGKGVAADLASDLADLGVTIISGGAHGIDRSAHEGALAVDGRTVGVLANGVDVAYPPGNTKLFDELGRSHLLVSELPPGAHPTRVRFLIRTSRAGLSGWDMGGLTRVSDRLMSCCCVSGSSLALGASLRDSQHAFSIFEVRTVACCPQRAHGFRLPGRGAGQAPGVVSVMLLAKGSPSESSPFW